MNLKKRKLLKKVLIAFSVFLFILLVGYAWLAYNIGNIEGNIIYQNSTVYSFSQNPITRWITITKNKQVIYHTYFKQTVFAAWIDGQDKNIYFVTSDTGTVEGAHGLYIYNGKVFKKVYQATTLEFANQLKSAGHLYQYRISNELDSPKREELINRRKSFMQNVFKVSPDGRYLFGTESGYESSIAFGVNLDLLEEINPNPRASIYFWSKDMSCAIGYEYQYGDSENITRINYRDGIFSEDVLDPQFGSSSFENVYWLGDGCEGYVEVVADYDRNGQQLEERSVRFYKFTEESDSMQAYTSLPSGAVMAEENSQPLTNIFFTLNSSRD